MLVVKHKRNECIGCNACVEHAPSHFYMADDGLVSLTRRKRLTRGIEFADASPDEYPELEAAAEDCPVHIISVHRRGQGGM